MKYPFTYSHVILGLVMNSKMKNALMAAGLVLWLCSLTACHTVKGAGKDIQKAGEAVEDASGR